MSQHSGALMIIKFGVRWLWSEFLLHHLLHCISSFIKCRCLKERMLKNHGMAWYLELKSYLLSLVPHNRKTTIGCLQGEQKWGCRREKRTEGGDNEEYGKGEERDPFLSLVRKGLRKSAKSGGIWDVFEGWVRFCKVDMERSGILDKGLNITSGARGAEGVQYGACVQCDWSMWIL